MFSSPELRALYEVDKAERDLLACTFRGVKNGRLFGGAKTIKARIGMK
jgi:hypothetical protein